MLLFAGLGNPGEQYKRHRHNIGFMAVDKIVHRHSVSQGPARWHAETFEGRLEGQKLLFLKPQTYMNKSGLSVGEAMRFFKLEPADVYIFHDELDLNFGKIKVKSGGGDAGHNGLKSITQAIGPDYNRIRIGISHPGDKARVHGHVLGNFTADESKTVETILDAIAGSFSNLVHQDHGKFLSNIAMTLGETAIDKTIKSGNNHRKVMPEQKSDEKTGAIGLLLKKLMKDKD